MFKKSFWIPYEDSAEYPTMVKAMQAISEYCEKNGDSCTFTGDDEVEINGKVYEICRGYENGSRGNYASNVRKNKGENMEDYTLVQAVSSYRLDGTDSRHKSVAKVLSSRSCRGENGQRGLLASGDCQARLC